MASVLTLFYNNPTQSNSSAGLLDVTAPAASTSTTGWTVGTIAVGNYSRLTYNTEVPTTNFTTTVQPSGAPIAVAGKFACDCYRLSTATTGSFSAGTWYSATSIIAVTASGGAQGRTRVRLWRSSSASGALPTELTAGAMVGTICTNFSTTVANTSSSSTAIGAFSLNNEYLFCQIAWEITTIGNGTTRDVLVRIGAASNQTNGSFLATAPFTISAGGAAPPQFFYKRRRLAAEDA